MGVLPFLPGLRFYTMYCYPLKSRYQSFPNSAIFKPAGYGIRGRVLSVESYSQFLFRVIRIGDI